MATKRSGRLPLVAKPFHYGLSYSEIDFVNYTFQGQVSIHLEALGTGPSEPNVDFSITLNAYEVSLQSAKLEKEKTGGEVLAITDAESFEYNLRDQTCKIVFSQSDMFNGWGDGTYVLTVQFCGFLNDQMCGLYRSFYTGLDNQRRVMATTQFEATDARRAFPCFDEPALKATFQLSLHNIPIRYQCLSNTPIASRHTTYDPASQTSFQSVTFQKTPKMSTYLVALIVGEFDAISETSSGIVTTVYTCPGKSEQGRFCLDTAVRCLDFFQDVFQIKYPLTKSDLVAIPDFAAGAMENWGLVTYREAKVLVSPEGTSESIRRGIARTVCHELAHMWFGNLATPEYWTQLWLKEGAARFLEFLAIETLFPEWNMWSEFVQSVCGLALALDSMKSSHPIEVPVDHPDEISQIFDAISYAKGASIIRMVHAYIGREAFLKGMQLYLTRFSHANAVTNDFFQALQDATPGSSDMVAFMTPWIKEMGYPILSLDDSGNVSVDRFLASGREKGQFTKWPIPVTAQVQGQKGTQGPWTIQNPDASRDDTEVLQEKIREWAQAGLWFKLNVDQTCFFRVSYSEAQWKRFESAMTPDSSLSVTDRLGLISDSFAAGKAGYASIVSSLELVKGFGSHENADYAVWQELSENLAGIASLFRSEDFFEKLSVFLKSIFSKQLSNLGWEKRKDETPRIGTLRATVIRMLLIAGDENVVKTAYEEFKKFESNPESAITGDLQPVIFRGALSYDEEGVFRSLINIFENKSTFPEEQRNILSALGHVKDSKLHEEFLEYALFSGKVRMQDIAFPLSALATSSDEGGKATWAFVSRNYDRLFRRLGSGPMWGPCIGLSCRGLKTSSEADAVESLFAERKIGSASRRLSQSLEVVRTNAARRERDRDVVRLYLNNS